MTPSGTVYFATPTKNLDTPEDMSPFGASPSAWASLGRLAEDAQGGQARNRWATATQWPLELLVTYLYMPDGAYSFLETAAPTLKR